MEQERAFSQPRALRDVLVVGSPVVVLGALGNLIGLDTLAGGATINLGYVLMIVIGGFILRQQGSSWRDIGLAKPRSRWKTAGYGVGAFVAAVVVFLATQTIAVGLLSALGQTPVGIDESRFNEIHGNLSFFM